MRPKLDTVLELYYRVGSWKAPLMSLLMGLRGNQLWHHSMYVFPFSYRSSLNRTGGFEVEFLFQNVNSNCQLVVPLGVALRFLPALFQF